MSTTGTSSDETSLAPKVNEASIDYSANVTQAEFFVIGSALLVVASFGTTFNGLAIAIFVRHRELRSPTNSFIIALCICDLLMSIIGAPIPAYNAFMQTYITSATLCAIDAFAVYFLSCTSIYLLAAISMDRYIIIVKPIPTLVVTQRAANLCIVLCFLFGFFWAVMPLFGWNEYTLEGIGIACSVTWNRKDSLYNSFIVVLFIACLLMPLIVMCFSYISIYLTVRKIFRGTFIRTLRKHYTIENRMVKTVMVMIGVFLVSWTPYAVVSFTTAFGSGIPMSRLVETIPALIAKSSCIWNPVIYVMTNNHFRSVLLAWIPFTNMLSLNPPKEISSKDDGEGMNNGNLHNVEQEDRKHHNISGRQRNSIDNDQFEDLSATARQWKMSTATMSTSLYPSASMNITPIVSSNTGEHDTTTGDSFIVTNSNGARVFVLASTCLGHSSQTENETAGEQPEKCCCKDEEQSYMPDCGEKSKSRSPHDIEKFNSKTCSTGLDNNVNGSDKKFSEGMIGKPYLQGSTKPFDLIRSHEQFVEGHPEQSKVCTESLIYTVKRPCQSAPEESARRSATGKRKSLTELEAGHSLEMQDEHSIISRSNSLSDVTATRFGKYKRNAMPPLAKIK